MSNLDKDNVKISLGVLAGLIGIGALTLLLTSKHEKKKNAHSPLNLVGKAIGHIGNILAEHDIKDPLPMIKDVEKKIEKNENKVADAIDWLAAGIQLWKKISK